MNNINEIFAPPIALVPISVLGSKLYTSIILKKSFLFSLSRVSTLSQSMEKISELTNNKKIIPCFLLKPGIISTLFSKMFQSDRIRSYDQYFRKEMKDVFGFYSSGDDKIFILINNKLLKVNKYGFVDTNKIASITVHESCHMAAFRNPLKFMKYFNSILVQYYKTYFSSIFSLESINDSAVENIIKLLFFRFEKSVNISKSGIDEYHKLLIEFKDSSTVDNFEKIVNDLFTAILIFTKSTSKFIDKMNKFSNVLNPLQSTYVKIFGGSDPGNIPIQELLYPSEVISIGSEIGNNKNIINNIFRLL